jgi:hypothetical protein
MAKAGPFKVYKNNGAASFELILPRYTDKGYFDKAGAVLVQIAPSSGKQQWDWTKKITFAIGIQDIANLFDSDTKKNRIFHDSDGTPKVLQFVPGTDQYEGTFMLTISEGAQATRKQLSCPLSNGEYQVVRKLLLDAIPIILGWR